MENRKVNIVYILQHIQQFGGREAVTIIGAFSNYDAAIQAIKRLSEGADFKDHLDYLHIAAYELDQIHWQEWDFRS